MAKKIEKLLEPIQVGPLLLKNRMVMSPVSIWYASPHGELTQQQVDYYTARAKNLPGLVVIEATAVDGRHVWETPELRIDETRFQAGLSKLSYIAHQHGVPVILQLHNPGVFGTDPISPSGVPSFVGGFSVQSRAITLKEAEEARDLFIEAAVRAMMARFDGVEIHGGTGYFLQQWVSPHSNKRTDRYGGSLENRIALPLEIVRGIRQKCGPDFAIGYALCADELLPDGTTIEESKTFTKALEKEGADYITVQSGTYETTNSENNRGFTLRHLAGLFDISQELKKVAKSIKVFARSSGAHEPLMWEEALEKGETDAITLGRPLLADPALPRKVIEGRLDDICYCTRCGFCEENVMVRNIQALCSQNPELGKERDYAIKRTDNPKQVLVVGGGPGGLEAAMVAALRGHKVTLMEKEAELGGNLRIASFPIGKEHFKPYVIDWRERQCRKAGVKIELGKEVTPEVVRHLRPDVVIIATGSTPCIPEIPGIDKPHVVIAEDVLTGKARVGKKVVVAGGGQVGVETAEFLMKKGLAESVTVIEMLPEILADMYILDKVFMFIAILPKSGVQPVTNMCIEEITDKGVAARSTDGEGKRQNFEADTVVLAMGYLPNIALYEGLKGEVPELYMLGDCVEVRQMADAIHEAAYIARQI